MRMQWKRNPSCGPDGKIPRIGVVLVFLLACAPAQPPALPEPASVSMLSQPAPPPADDFWLPGAEAHLANLAPHGGRTPGDVGDEAARKYLRSAFESAGAEMAPGTAPGRRSGSAPTHLLARIAGVSRDVVLLVAPYSVLGSTAAVDDSGAALLLELARVYSRSQPPYTLVFALAAVSPGEGGAGREPAATAVAPSLAAATTAASLTEVRGRMSKAGRSLAAELRVNPWVKGRVRAVLVYETAARGTGRVARDLRSHPIYRDVFWQTAVGLGLESAFPSDAGWSSPVGLQGGLREAPLGPLLALIDEQSARPELGLAAQVGRDTGAEHQDAAGLQAIGRVSVSALSRLMRQFEKVDAFTAQLRPAERP